MDNYQTSRGRGRQFILTPFNLYIKTLLASKRNQIYSEASSTRFSAINLLYLRDWWNSSRIYIKSQTFPDHQTSRGTQFNWHFSIYISEHFTPLNAMKYIINLLKQTFRMTLNMHLRSTNQIHMDLKNHRHLDNYQTSRGRGRQFNLTPFDLYIKTLLASKRNQIYYKSSSTNISDYHQTYNYALQIKIYIDLK